MQQDEFMLDSTEIGSAPDLQPLPTPLSKRVLAVLDESGGSRGKTGSEAYTPACVAGHLLRHCPATCDGLKRKKAEVGCLQQCDGRGGGGGTFFITTHCRWWAVAQQRITHQLVILGKKDAQSPSQTTARSHAFRATANDMQEWPRQRQALRRHCTTCCSACLT